MTRREYMPGRSPKCANNAGVKFVFASSCSVYGIGGADLVNENSPAQPQTPYSLNKLQVEQDLQALGRQKFFADRVAVCDGVWIVAAHPF